VKVHVVDESPFFLSVNVPPHPIPDPVLLHFAAVSTANAGAAASAKAAVAMAVTTISLLFTLVKFFKECSFRWLQ